MFSVRQEEGADKWVTSHWNTLGSQLQPQFLENASKITA